MSDAQECHHSDVYNGVCVSCRTEVGTAPTDDQARIVGDLLGVTLTRDSAVRHLDALADTGDAYTAFHGWTLVCCWCPVTSRGRTKADAVAGMQEHYDRVCGEGKAGEIRV